MKRFGLVLLGLVLGAFIRGDQARSAVDWDVFEGSDMRVSFCHYNAADVNSAASDITFRIHDVVTGTQIFTHTITNPGKCVKYTVGGTAYTTFLRPGYCAIATGTPCTADVECPTGEKCKFLEKELHMLTLEFHFPDGGQGTHQVPFYVTQLRFWPFL